MPLTPAPNEWRAVLSIFSTREITIEEELAKSFREIGPFVAIGRPGELAAPLGASRGYVSGESWRERVRELAVSAALVVMGVDQGAGIRWELQEVPGLVGLDKIMIILPQTGWQTRGKELLEQWESLRREFEFLPEIDSQTVAIFFSSDGKPTLLSSKKGDLEEVPNIVQDAIRDWKTKNHKPAD
jgi:hypothetical protein